MSPHDRKNSNSNSRNGFILIAAIGAAMALVFPQFAGAQGAAGKVNAEETNGLRVFRSRTTGLASFVAPAGGGVIAIQRPAGPGGRQPIDFLIEHGALFGVTDPGAQLVETKQFADPLGQRHTTYEQLFKGVPVYSGMIRVHQNANGDVIAANGDFYPIPEKLSVTPKIDALAAGVAGLGATESGQPEVELAELVVVDPGWYGDAGIGAHLAYFVVVSDFAVPMREAFFIDAHSGEILDQWNLMYTAKNRLVYDGEGGAALPGTLAREEGDPPVGGPEDVNRAYDYAGDIYDYYFRAFARDSIDDNGESLILTVNSTAPPCPNAFWNGAQMVFCSGTVTDDITAHEMTHGVTERTANLIYQNQSGQLNEAYSDIFGELIDLFNGNAAFPGPPSGTPWGTHPTGPGLDTPNNLRSTCSAVPTYPNGVRWMLGEDATAFGGAIRDMWDPTCAGDPDRNNSPLQTCPGFDNGGVHSGSGVANHAFSIITDGKTFNGFTVTGIGPIKSGAIFYRALTVYLTPSSDYGDAYVALNQAAADLVGTTPADPRTGGPSSSAITAADAVELDEALQAVEMNTDGSCGATVPIFNTSAPNQCTPQVAIFFDDAEGGTNGWTVSNSGADTPYDWVLDSTLPAARAGTAWFIDDLDNDCSGATDETGTHFLISPTINIPTGVFDPTLEFTQFITVEPEWDGGNVKISVNGGAFQLIPPAAFTHNPYNTAIRFDSTNPMANEPAFSGADSNWGTSQAVLSSLAGPGDSIQLRFEFGKDWCTGIDGWYIDDINVYACTTSCTDDEECSDGLFCNGVETCVASTCQTTGDPCTVGEFCDEANDTCVPVAFAEDFENGNAQGWNLSAPGSSATSGNWVIGDPIGTFDGGTPSQPENAFEGTDCAFTGQNSSLGDGDVDNGATILLSPNIDLSSALTAELTFSRWFYNRDLGEDSGDIWRAEVSSNGGSNWVQLESLGTNQSANSWSLRTFDLGSFITLTGTVRLRFTAADGIATGNIIEAALDDVRITVTVGCTFDSDCDDDDACNGLETCLAGTCVPGEPAECNDGNECTDDSCDPETGCVFTNNNNPCNDGLFCTPDDFCSGGSCVGSGAPCPGESCNEEFDQCVPFGDGDFDDDSDHDLKDFAAFQNCFAQSTAGACGDADFDANLAVNLNDYVAFEQLFDGP